MNDALQEDERRGIRPLNGKKLRVGFKSRKTRREVDDGFVRIVDTAEAGCVDTRHSSREWPGVPDCLTGARLGGLDSDLRRGSTPGQVEQG